MSRTFSLNVSRFVRKTGITLEEVVKKTVFEMFRGVLFVSPVRTGRFRGSWRIGINQTDLGVLPDLESSHAPPRTPLPPDAALAAGMTMISNIKVGQVIIISNNLPYAKFLEGPPAGSLKAPDGVMYVTFLRVVSEMQTIIKSV